MSIRILIADDHHVVRRGLVFFLKTQKDIEIAGEAKNGAEAVQLAERLKPDLILMDLMMPVMDGIEATKEIKKKHGDAIQILMLTSFSDQNHVIPAIEAGAAGYQLKDIEPDELVASIRKLLSGENSLHPKATNHLLTRISKQDPPHKIHALTKREKDVLAELTKGKSNKEIASSLFITEKTVKTHISNIFSKLEVSDRTQAALYAVKHNLA
ncbi:LuxR family transcriptional regulator [[Bacillus] enclensis]|uniref:DNA-binding response regulator, NarL/FixJ family, contains REC and HTH domains n=1 Tax=[Bacillus] enclensis TaxID=1402860 RepID=A0A0V8HHM6_9BACI|nr:response regulator transcription factor [[Bacillus] enclensis]KSU62060.1 LuxR family transcriptional regulator [[Bacillus] enclensis]SCB98609.1 DNA-binding response regulator, NarL/FixJ family, contains REC and HTH domains [[Bacillus] enclensis]